MENNRMQWLKNRLSLKEEYDKHFNVKQSENGYWSAECLFCEDAEVRYPVTINEEKGIFYCSHCHMAGDAISLYCKVHKVPIAEAVDMLCKEKSLKIPEEVLEMEDYEREARKIARKNQAINIRKEIAGPTLEWEVNKKLTNLNNAMAYLEESRYGGSFKFQNALVEVMKAQLYMLESE